MIDPGLILALLTLAILGALFLPLVIFGVLLFGSFKRRARDRAVAEASFQVLRLASFMGPHWLERRYPRFDRTDKWSFESLSTPEKKFLNEVLDFSLHQLSRDRDETETIESWRRAIIAALSSTKKRYRERVMESLKSLRGKINRLIRSVKLSLTSSSRNLQSMFDDSVL